MILVGVGADHSGKFLHAPLLQNGYHQLAVIPVAAVDQQILSVALQKGTVRLPHIDILHSQTVPGDSRFLLQVFRYHIAARQNHQGENPGNQLFLIDLHSVTNPLCFFPVFIGDPGFPVGGKGKQGVLFVWQPLIHHLFQQGVQT